MKVLSWLYVPKCAVCKKRLNVDREIPLCDECLLRWEKEKQGNCPICGQNPGQCWCGIKLDVKGSIYSEQHLSYYSTKTDSVCKTMILGMKKRMSHQLAQMLAEELSELISRNIDLKNCVIVNVPRMPRSVRYYGFDQALILAKGISERLDLDIITALFHKGKTIQKKLNQKERAENARKSYELIKESKPLLKNKNIILVDDVVTTGATVSRCAELLKRAGAQRIYVVSIAKSY